MRAAQSHAGGPVLALVHPEPGGLRLVIGEYLAVRARQDDGLLIGIIGLAGLVAGLGLIGGVLVALSIRNVICEPRTCPTSSPAPSTP